MLISALLQQCEHGTEREKMSILLKATQLEQVPQCLATIFEPNKQLVVDVVKRYHSFLYSLDILPCILFANE